jgi:hypothetical protein
MLHHHGRLEPGKMFLVDMNEGRIVNDEEIKEAIAAKQPYSNWLEDNLVYLKQIPYNDCPVFLDQRTSR